jgi:hypothetical protein
VLEQAHGLIVQVGVQVALLAQVGDDLFLAPRGPKVGGERYLAIGGEQVDDLVEIAGPDPRVADHRPPQGQQVVQVVGGVLGHAQSVVVGKEEVHLHRALRPGGHLELDPHPVNDLLLAGVGDLNGGGTRLTVPYELVAPNPAPTWPVGLLARLAPYMKTLRDHGHPGVHVLRHRRLHEPMGHHLRRGPRTRDNSTNFAPLALLSFGDSWHNAHHAYPRLARHGVDRDQIDSSAALIRFFERVRCASDVKWPTSRNRAKRRNGVVKPPGTQTESPRPTAETRPGTPAGPRTFATQGGRVHPLRDAVTPA